VIILISLTLIFAFGLTTSIGQETVKFKGTIYWFPTKTEVMKVDDTEGHIIAITESKGVDVGSGMVYHVWCFADFGLEK
jgi:hypothetical protein